MRLETFLKDIKPIAERLDLDVFFGSMANWNKIRRPFDKVLIIEPPTTLPLEDGNECFSDLRMMFRIGIKRNIGDKILNQLGEDVYYHQTLRDLVSELFDEISKHDKFLITTRKRDVTTQFWEMDVSPTPNSYAFIRFELPIRYYLTKFQTTINF